MPKTPSRSIVPGSLLFLGLARTHAYHELTRSARLEPLLERELVAGADSAEINAACREESCGFVDSGAMCPMTLGWYRLVPLSDPASAPATGAARQP